MAGIKLKQKFASSAMGRAGFAEILPPDQFCLGSAGLDWRSRRQMKWFQFSAIEFIPWLRSQPCIPCSAKRWSWTMSVLTKVSWSLGSRTVLTRPTQERICSFFRGKKPRLFFLTQCVIHISYGRTTHRTQCLFPTWMNRRVINASGATWWLNLQFMQVAPPAISVIAQ